MSFLKFHGQVINVLQLYKQGDPYYEYNIAVTKINKIVASIIFLKIGSKNKKMHLHIFFAYNRLDKKVKS